MRTHFVYCSVIKALILNVLLLSGGMSVLISETFVSEPQGYTKVKIPGALTQSTPSITTLSLTLRNEVAYIGELSSIDGVNSQVVDQKAAWANGSLSSQGTPYYFKMTSGKGVGRVFRIVANTSNVLTLDLGVPAVGLTESNVGLVIGDRYEIFPADTLGSVFGTAAVPFKSGVSEPNADSIKIWSDQSQAWVTYFHNGSEWRKVLGGTSNQNNSILPFGRGIQIVRRDLAPLEFVLSGSVVVGVYQTNVGQSNSGSLGKNFISLPFVKNLSVLTLGTSGFDQMQGWAKNLNPNLADQVQIYSETSQAWMTYYHNGTEWRRVLGGSASQNETVLEAGKPMMVIRRSSPTGGGAIYTQKSTYDF